ncbi:MAG: LytTR family DNA-binding domain-containing protein [Oscillospiraceae bacterium]
MNIAVLEDSEADRIQFIGFVKRYAREHSLLLRIFAYENGEQFLAKANLADIDVLFVDIFMNKINGMEVAQKVRALGSACPIVFTSASTAFAVKSYEVRAFDYLVKPMIYEKVEKVMGMLDAQALYSSRYITVKEGRELRKLLLCDLIFVDYHNHYLQMHMTDTVVKTYMRFEELEEALSPYRRFLTCYRCVTINMDHVEKIQEKYFLMSNGEYIPINRNHIKEIKKQYTNYIFGETESI